MMPEEFRYNIPVASAIPCGDPKVCYSSSNKTGQPTINRSTTRSCDTNLDHISTSLKTTVVNHSLPGLSTSDQTLPGPSTSDQTLQGSSTSDQTLLGSPTSDQTLPGSSTSDQTLPGPSTDSIPLKEQEAVPFLDSADSYLHLLKCQKGISIFGESGCVLVLKDYQETKNKLHLGKYVLVQRQGASFLQEECHWVYCCSCNINVSREKSSLYSNINLTYAEFLAHYPDCIHVKAAKMVYRKYDAENEIEPQDETLQNQDVDHRYSATEELYEVPDAAIVYCRSLSRGRFGLVNSKLECLTCKKKCEHSIMCSQISKNGLDSQYSDLIQQLLSSGSSLPTSSQSVYKQKVISFKKIPYVRSAALSSGLQNLQEAVGDIIVPDLNECQNCGSILVADDPVECECVAYDRVVIVTNTTLSYAKAYYRPCTSCDNVTFEGQSKCLLNLGSYLVGYDVLRSYMHSFLHGRRPLYTFYQTWCDIHLDYGNIDIQAEFPYQKFRHAWHTFLGLLDIDYSEGFSCPDCGGDDSSPETIICDGTSLSFQRRMWEWKDDTQPPDYKSLSSFSLSDRVFLHDVKTRGLLKFYAMNGQFVRGIKLKPLDYVEKQTLLSSLKSVSLPLFNIINDIEGDLKLLPIYRKLLLSLASPSSVCALIRPNSVVEFLIQAILKGMNVREEPFIWTNIHNYLPVLFEIFEQHDITDNIKLLLSELWNRSVSPFVHAEEDQFKSDIHLIHDEDDDLSFFPSLKSTEIGDYLKWTNKQRRHKVSARRSTLDTQVCYQVSSLCFAHMAAALDTNFPCTHNLTTSTVRRMSKQMQD